MARKTFTQLQSEAHDHTQTITSDTAINTFLKQEINNAQTFMFSELGSYMARKQVTTSTVSGQTYYSYPQDIFKPEYVYITINSVDYNLTPITDEAEWIRLNAITYTATAIPTHFFPRRDDFGIYPAPQGVYTMTLTQSYRSKEMQNEDYTTGTVSVTNGDATVTGSGTTFTSNMVGRWLKVDDDGSWYRIASFTSTTSVELDNVYSGTTSSGEAYTIGETPELPEEAHLLIPYYAAARFFGSRRKSKDDSQFWENMFMTGDGYNTNRDPANIINGFIGLKKRYANRTSSGVVYRNKHKSNDVMLDKLWATTISA